MSSNAEYWKANLKLMIYLLLVWFVVSFVCGILVVDYLNQFRFFGYKLGFWFSQQGSIYVFVVLIFVYVWRMNQLDIKFNVDEGSDNKDSDNKDSDNKDSDINNSDIDDNNNDVREVEEDRRG